ncbi:hypothetical protein B4Q13_15155, partial [Lacticaseibacillus rhamnosus]
MGRVGFGGGHVELAADRGGGQVGQRRARLVERLRGHRRGQIRRADHVGREPHCGAGIEAGQGHDVGDEPAGGRQRGAQIAQLRACPDQHQLARVELVEIPVPRQEIGQLLRHRAAVAGKQHPQVLHRRPRSRVVEVAHSANLVVLRTPPGSAHVVASALDRASLASVLGTIAGDDTVVAVCNETVGGAVVAAELAAVRAQVLPAIEWHGAIAYWIIDDTIGWIIIAVTLSLAARGRVRVDGPPERRWMWSWRRLAPRGKGRRLWGDGLSLTAPSEEDPGEEQCGRPACQDHERTRQLVVAEVDRVAQRGLSGGCGEAGGHEAAVTGDRIPGVRCAGAAPALRRRERRHARCREARCGSRRAAHPIPVILKRESQRAPI